VSEHVREFKQESWQQEVLGADGPVLVDFWAEWCPPCRALAPTVEGVAVELAGRITVGKLNVDDHPDLAMQYGVSSIPTLLVFRRGEIVDRYIGRLVREDLHRFLEPHLLPATASPAPTS
jgi:thioredoxin